MSKIGFILFTFLLHLYTYLMSVFFFSPILIIVCFFTFLIHITESLAYSLRLAGVRSGKIAVAMSFVKSTLLISRLSNMFQAPLLGSMVDSTILANTPDSLVLLESQFRVIIFTASLGALVGAFITPTCVELFRSAIIQFQLHGSMPKLIANVFKPRIIVKIISHFRLPRFSMLKEVSYSGFGKGFLVVNCFVASIYCIGVLCSLIAGAYLPEFRSTSAQLSGIVNGLATIMFTLFVDPPGARVTDSVSSGDLNDEHLKGVVIGMQLGKIFGTLVLAQLLFKPFSSYILFVTRLISDLAQ
jgi:hypothetical protein